MNQLTIFDLISDSKYLISGGCSECCMKCLYWWEGRCKHGGCYDDFMAKHYPREKLTGEHWTGWSRCEDPGEQNHWCRSGRYLHLDVTKLCPDYVKYEGQMVKQCLYAPVSVFQDGYISCTLNDSVGCDWCYRQFERRMNNGFD